MVITGLTRNQVVLTGSWVRIPPAPPSKNPVTMRVSGFFFFCARSENHPILGCSFRNFGKNSFLLYAPLFSAFCSHLLPKSPASGKAAPHRERPIAPPKSQKNLSLHLFGIGMPKRNLFFRKNRKTFLKRLFISKTSPHLFPLREGVCG